MAHLPDAPASPPALDVEAVLGPHGVALARTIVEDAAANAPDAAALDAVLATLSRAIGRRVQEDLGTALVSELVAEVVGERPGVPERPDLPDRPDPINPITPFGPGGVRPVRPRPHPLGPLGPQINPGGVDAPPTAPRPRPPLSPLRPGVVPQEGPIRPLTPRAPSIGPMINPGSPTNPGNPPGPPGSPTNPGNPPGPPGSPTNPGNPPGPPGSPTNPGNPPGPPGSPTNPGNPVSREIGGRLQPWRATGRRVSTGDVPQQARHIVLEEFLAPGEVAELREHALASQTEFRTSEVIRAGAGEGEVDFEHRRSRVLFDLGEWHERFRARLMDHLPAVLGKLGWPDFEPTDVEIQLTATGDGEYFRLHTDSDHVSIAGRTLTFVYFLNADPSPFEGGELRLYDSEFEDGRQVAVAEAAVIEPNQNTIVFFPSSLMHEVSPVRGGNGDLSVARLTVNGWLHS